MKNKKNNNDLASKVKKSENSYSKEQIRSKKGLLAFDMLLDKKAKN
ncbi:hypothetical protein [Halarcobacter anaerophilus]|nr:hypothetical protein [Halarcobacter anaerophilus]